ncbi:MAG: 2,3-bisphosphoglycerate-independent phosphoglycerate mutase [Acidobacteria bacterium]|jgi:2,3-bisphosphoglycerate-independent phosphoglycerate mutase|nr:MAG: 2,3-bisphosphoglycerate-independent phosphoglycerate mutase [Acidobacteriota bacterium]GIU82345.1 MAG: 2,3-bisphosphoglycerate-independent phosphoglycerate mutase [Pyrinomonadaceae bacterium]
MEPPLRRPLVLIVIAGWGYRPQKSGNAIALAHKPYYDWICREYPRTLLKASGTRVGLPEGTAGDSQIGYMNIGAGRIVQTDIVRIKQALESGAFYSNPALIEAMQRARESSLHLIGLLSNAEVHSSQEALFALLRMAKNHGVERVFVHGILDGKDVPARTGDVYIEALEVKMNEIGVGKIATICGRYFAMDKDENWGLTARAYTMLVHAEGEKAINAAHAVREAFLRGISDEYIRPIVLINREGDPVATIRDGDVVIFFNHRADGMRQLVKALVQNDKFSGASKPRIHAVCLTEYCRGLNLRFAFPKEEYQGTLAEVFTNYGISNCRIAGEERIQLVTESFDSGFQAPGNIEKYISIKPRNLSNGFAPEKESFKITDAVLWCLEKNEDDVLIVDFDAPEAAAKLGSLEKTIEAVQFIDTCIGAIVEKVLKMQGVVIITSTHGNSEEMISSSGKPNAANTTNPVPFHLIDESSKTMKLRPNMALKDVAPTILEILGIEKPVEMTGESLELIEL